MTEDTPVTPTPPTAKPRKPRSTGNDYRIAADDDGIRLDRWFKRHRDDVPHALIARWTRTGSIRLDGAKTDPAERIATGQLLSVPQLPVAADTTPRKRQPRVQLSPEEIELAQSMLLHQDSDAIILNKLPGLATQGGTGTSQHVDGLLDAFFDEDKGRPRLVHRLDKDTSGILLIARSPGAAAKFSKSFAGRTARKTYWALVVGVPDIASGQIDLPIAKQPGSGGEKMHVDEENGQSARTRYRVIERAGNAAAFVELQPLTGRTHQLRVHMAAIGHPIVGDGKYGGKAAFLTGTISRKLHLHARRLRIAHPAGGEIDVTAPMAHHFAESMADLGFEEAAGDVMAQRPEKIAPAPNAKIRVDARENRRARKGERRSRGVAAAPARPSKAGGKAGGKSAKPSGPPRGKPVGPKPTGAKPTGAKPAGPKPAGGAGRPARPAGGRPSSR